MSTIFGVQCLYFRKIVKVSEILFFGVLNLGELEYFKWYKSKVVKLTRI